MEKFDKLTAVAAPMPIINIDTDMIIPKDYLKTIKRTGRGLVSEDVDPRLGQTGFRVVGADSFVASVRGK